MNYFKKHFFRKNKIYPKIRVKVQNPTFKQWIIMKVINLALWLIPRVYGNAEEVTNEMLEIVKLAYELFADETKTN
jgi:hypothetical protein